ncbi:PGL/p-HBAD biosynthesis glycosyltransferase [Thalassocella blandensis]|nr:PGL/p-HBAD biosynthesis glycosyltransferase [Thalassocella blandensis]
MVDKQPFFTVFIPTYNRGYCIDKALLSCNESTFKDFEVVLVDDGSTDDTDNVVEKIKDALSFSLVHERQKNQGKHMAFNRAVSVANGKYFLTLDSDDTLLPNGLSELYENWKLLESEGDSSFASIEFRCLEEGVPSSAVKDPYLDSTYVERRLSCPTTGEKRSAYRLDVLKQYPYPKFDGERYCRPGLIDIRMAKTYKTRFVNTVVIDVGHFDDGIGANRRKIVVNAPQSYRHYFLEEIKDHAKWNSEKDLKSFYKRYCRCSINAGVPLSQQLREIPDKLKLLSVYPEAWFGSVGDKRYRS